MNNINNTVAVVGDIPSDNFNGISPHITLYVPRGIKWIYTKYPQLYIIWQSWALIILFYYFLRCPATHIICNFHMQLFSARLAQIMKRNKFLLFYYIQAYEPDFFPKKNIYHAFLRFLSRQTYRLKSIQLTNSNSYHFLNKYITRELEDIIPPGIDFGLFRPYPRKLNQNITVGMLYSPDIFKGSNVALKSLISLNKLNLPVRITIGTSYSKLPPTAIPIVKILNENDLVKFYQSLDILVAVPNRQFGAPHLPIMEGMACGCAVVCTNFYLAVQEKTALIVPPDSPKEIQKAIIRLVSDSKLRNNIIREGLMSVNNYNWENVGKKFINRIFLNY